MGNYIHCLENGKFPCLAGYPKFENREIFGLKVGDMIKKIGIPGKNGKETSSCRITEFLEPARYAGTIHTRNDDWMAFTIQVEGKPFHLLWGFSEEIGEIYRMDMIEQTIRIHKAIFEKEK